MTTTPVGMRCPECSKQRTRVVRGVRSAATQPRVTYALLAINVAAFLAEGRFSLGGGGEGNSVYVHGALLGSSESPGLLGEGVAHGQWWRLITGGFLHAGLLHIFFNMYVLYVLGQMLEPTLGHVKFAAIYLVSLLAGSLGALLLAPHTLTVGASGAVFGLMGAIAMEMRARSISIMESGIGFLILINLVLSFTVKGISIGGHIGGLIGGALAILALQLGERRRSQALAYGACAAIGVASFVAAIAVSESTQREPAASPPAGQIVLPE